VEVLVDRRSPRLNGRKAVAAMQGSERTAGIRLTGGERERMD